MDVRGRLFTGRHTGVHLFTGRHMVGHLFTGEGTFVYR